MSAQDTSLAPIWFRISAALALIWNLLGVAAYIAQATITEAQLAALPHAQRLLYESTPGWATAAFATAVFAGALGSLLLVLRRSVATPILILSLLAVLVQMFHSFFMSSSFAVYGPGGLIMPVLVIVIAIGLVWLGRKGQKLDWLA